MNMILVARPARLDTPFAVASPDLSVFAPEDCGGRQRHSTPLPPRANEPRRAILHDDEPTTLACISAQLAVLSEQMRDLSSVVVRLMEQSNGPQLTRQFYTVEEAAKFLGKSSYTVREYCRQGRINAEKRTERRGGSEVWNIATEEIARIKDEGLLQADSRRNAA